MVTGAKRGRPPVGVDDKIVPFSEFSAPNEYKKAITYLSENTGIGKQLIFREALKEYLGKHSIEFFLRKTEDEIADRQGKVTDMQAAIQQRSVENRARADAFFNRKLDPDMSKGFDPGMGYVEQMAAQVCSNFMLSPEDMLEIGEAVYVHKKEMYRDRHPKTRYVGTTKGDEW